jgi:hypothetical protein
LKFTCFDLISLWALSGYRYAVIYTVILIGDRPQWNIYQ